MAVTSTPKQSIYKRVPNDPSNLHISRAEFIEKRAKAKELEARLKVAARKIEDEIESEHKAQKNVEVPVSEEIETVETRGRKKKIV